MDFKLKNGDLKWQNEIRKFVDEKIRPRASEIDDTGQYPWDNVHALAGLGIYRFPIPKAYDGLDEKCLTQCVVQEELAKGCASTGLIVCASWILSTIIKLGGNQEQKTEYLPPMARGEKTATIALTEYVAGSDAGAIETTALRTGNYYELNGVKRFAGGAGISEYYVIAAKTDIEKGGKGISLFVVKSGTPGLKVTRIERKMGLRGQPHGDLVLTNCRIPDKNLLGEINEGLKLVTRGLDYARLTGASNAVGIGQSAYDEALTFSKKRVTFGQKIINHQAVRFMLVDMALGLETGRLLTQKAATLIDEKEESNLIAKYCKMAKLYCSEMVMLVTDNALQIRGATGYTKESSLERCYRDARAWKLMDGTSEIHRIMIGREL